MQNTNWVTKSGDELVSELMKKVESYEKYLQNSGILAELKDSYTTFYGNSQIGDAGSQGELKLISINHYSALIRNLVSMVTNQKPAWQPIAANSDSQSQASAILAGSLLDFYIKEKRVDRLFRQSCLMVCFLREAFVGVTWDTTKGSIIHVGNPEEGILPIHEGDLNFSLYNLTDVISDWTKRESKDRWYIVREFKDRFDLISQFPEFENDFQKIDNNMSTRIGYNIDFKNDESNLVPFYTFYHESCASLPNGRMVQFVENKIITDMNLPYPRIPIIKLSIEDTFDSAISHSPMMDVLPIQKGIDTMASMILTNNQAFGVQSIWSKKGNGLKVSEIASGLNLIESESKPEPIQLTASSGESYRFLDMLIQQAQLLSGVSSVVRGDAPSGMSGSAMALLANQSLQFMNSLQSGYQAMIEDVGTLSLNILQTYANTTRVATLAGKNNNYLLKEWSAKDIAGIQRVTIDSGNSLSKTASGRLTIAQDLMAQGLIKDPKQYLMLLQTGNIEPLFEHETTQLIRIRKENELLSSGNIPIPIISDPHEIEIREHLSVLDSPESRENPNIVTAVLSHVQEHINLARSMPIELQAILGRQPLPQSTVVNTGSPEMINNENPLGQAAQQVNTPNMPKDALTNEPFNNQN